MYQGMFLKITIALKQRVYFLWGEDSYTKRLKMLVKKIEFNPFTPLGVWLELNLTPKRYYLKCL